MFQPQTPRQAVVFAEVHVRALGYSHLSPIEYVKRMVGDDVTAALTPNTALREKEILPGLRLRSGSSEITIIKIVPTRKEVVYKNRAGDLFRMPSENFIKLAKQQGYRKVWDLRSFLRNLRNLLKPVLSAIPLMWVLKWVVNSARSRPFATSLPKASTKLP